MSVAFSIRARNRASLRRRASVTRFCSVMTSNTATKCWISGLYTETENHIWRASTYLSNF